MISIHDLLLAFVFLVFETNRFYLNVCVLSIIIATECLNFRFLSYLDDRGLNNERVKESTTMNCKVRNILANPRNYKRSRLKLLVLAHSLGS